MCHLDDHRSRHEFPLEVEVEGPRHKLAVVPAHDSNLLNWPKTVVLVLVVLQLDLVTYRPRHPDVLVLKDLPRCLLKLGLFELKPARRLPVPESAAAALACLLSRLTTCFSSLSMFVVP